MLRCARFYGMARMLHGMHSVMADARRHTQVQPYEHERTADKGRRAGFVCPAAQCGPIDRLHWGEPVAVSQDAASLTRPRRIPSRAVRDADPYANGNGWLLSLLRMGYTTGTAGNRRSVRPAGRAAHTVFGTVTQLRYGFQLLLQEPLFHN